MKSFMKRKMSTILAVSAIGFSAIISSPTAMATPFRCTAVESGKAWTGTCAGGRGQFRIRLDCNNWPDQTSPWTDAGKYAVANCVVEHARGYSFEVRD